MNGLEGDSLLVVSRGIAWLRGRLSNISQWLTTIWRVLLDKDNALSKGKQVFFILTRKNGVIGTYKKRTPFGVLVNSLGFTT
jgi:hypothetical protein